MVRGARQARALVRATRPHVCLVTGGYVCGPVALACWLQKVPVLVYLPDMTPGWAIRSLSRIATRVAVSFPDAAHHFGGEPPRGKAVVTGYPVRAELVDAAQSRSQARRQLAAVLEAGLEDDDPLVLVQGGSQGARSINRATWAALADWLPHAHVLHVIGTRDWEQCADERRACLQQLPPALADRYHPVAYLHDEMVLALAAADLCVARAGASTLGEFPVARLPSILVPLPFAGSNQQANAQVLTARNCALVVEDAALSQQLSPTLLALLRDEPQRRRMETALAALAKPDAAQAIADELRVLAG
jgi:UDP-N-acetylglucosamine--N-acetylmuramyl-(pentapeptide) pyrophosphoryl-undecaprenol N-acetylglucosamine transferase